MSRAAIAAAARRVVESANLEPQARADVVCTLERTANDTPPFLLALGLEAGLEPAVALTRAVGVAFHIAALQLADDIADGDCDYLVPALGAGTIAQFMLQNLGYLALLEAHLPARVLRDTAIDLAAGASAQSLEVRTRSWKPEESRVTAERFGATHYAAYFRIMLSGTVFEADALAWGRALGIGAAVSSDLTSRDPRVLSLRAEDRAELITWALAATAPASGARLRCLSSALERIELQLVRWLALTAEEGERSTPPLSG